MVRIWIYWSPHFTEEEGCCLFPALIFFERVESIIIGHIDNIAILGSVWNRIWDIYGLPRSDSRGKFNNKCQLLLPGVLYTDHTVRSERRRVPGIKWILHTERKKKTGTQQVLWTQFYTSVLAFEFKVSKTIWTHGSQQCFCWRWNALVPGICA